MSDDERILYYNLLQLALKIILAKNDRGGDSEEIRSKICQIMQEKIRAFKTFNFDKILKYICFEGKICKYER